MQLSPGCWTPRAERRHRPCNPKSKGCQFLPHREGGHGTLRGKEQPWLTRARHHSLPQGAAEPVPTHWTGSSTPAQPALFLILRERATEATNLSRLIPHFSQRFKKHPWLTAGEGVWRPSANGPLCSSGRSTSGREPVLAPELRSPRCRGWSPAPQTNRVG